MIESPPRGGVLTRSAHPGDLSRTPVSIAPAVRIVHPLPAGVWGGREICNLELAARLTRRGVPTRITAIGEGDYSRMPVQYVGTVDVERVPWRAEQISFLDWHRFLRARPAPILVFSNWKWHEPGIIPLVAARLNYRHVIVHQHNTVDPLPESAPGRILGGLVPRPRTWRARQRLRGRILSAMAGKTICVGHAIRERLVEHYRYHPERTVAVHNGIDCAHYRFDPEARARYRGRFGISERAVVFGAVGRIHNGVKRHDLSLRAFARLVKAHPEDELHFLLVGDGPNRGEMIELASALGISERVTIAPYTAEPWEAHCALDVFLMPSTTEGFGLALAEAMASERCVVAMAIDGIAEILAGPDLGFPVPPDDAEGFHAAMAAALRLGASGRRALGERARAWVEQRFDADRQFGELIAQILGRR